LDTPAPPNVPADDFPSLFDDDDNAIQDDAAVVGVGSDNDGTDDGAEGGDPVNPAAGNAPAPGGDGVDGDGAGDRNDDEEPQGGGDDGDDGYLDLADGVPDLANYYDPKKNLGFIHHPPKEKKRKRQPRVRTYLSTAEPDIQLAKDPISVEEALRGPYAEYWRRAMVEEWESLVKMGTFELSDLPDGQILSAANGYLPSNAILMGR
jgi:hypothetical protein